MSKRSDKGRTWRATQDTCPHCGHRGMQAEYKGRRLMAEQCPDCRHSWQHVTRWKHSHA